MLEEMDTDLYMTILLAEIDLKTGDCVMAQAGHPHPLIQRADGLLDFVGQGGLPIGLIPDADFTTVHCKLEQGDRLLIYSDGFTEAEDMSGAMLDEAGLAGLMTTHSNTRGPQLLDNLFLETQAYCGGSDVADDLSAVLVEF